MLLNIGNNYKQDFNKLKSKKHAPIEVQISSTLLSSPYGFGESGLQVTMTVENHIRSQESNWKTCTSKEFCLISKR